MCSCFKQRVGISRTSSIMLEGATVHDRTWSFVPRMSASARGSLEAQTGRSSMQTTMAAPPEGDAPSRMRRLRSKPHPPGISLEAERESRIAVRKALKAQGKRNDSI